MGGVVGGRPAASSISSCLFQKVLKLTSSPKALRGLQSYLAALQKNVDMTRELGFVPSTLDVKKHADLSMVEEAAKRLK